MTNDENKPTRAATGLEEIMVEVTVGEEKVEKKPSEFRVNFDAEKGCFFAEGTVSGLPKDGLKVVEMSAYQEAQAKISELGRLNSENEKSVGRAVLALKECLSRIADLEEDISIKEGKIESSFKRIDEFKAREARLVSQRDNLLHTWDARGCDWDEIEKERIKLNKELGIDGADAPSETEAKSEESK